MRENDNDTVLYIQCPNCKKGWYGKVLDTDIDIDYSCGDATVNSIMVEGIAPVDVAKELTCLNCGHHYTPVDEVSWDFKNNTWSPYSYINNRVLKMWEFVARFVTTCKGK